MNAIIVLCSGTINVLSQPQKYPFRLKISATRTQSIMKERKYSPL